MFMGTEFIWFTGIVEDALSDPLKLGRVKVRIFGIHSDKLVEDNSSGEGIPTDNLPWAVPMMPINGPSLNGLGQSATGLVNGTTVIGFARDGSMYQDLIIMGTLNGIPQNIPVSDLGFNDPDLVYPLETHIQESDINRLARNEKIDLTIVQTKLDSVEQEIPKAIFTDTDISEPTEEPETTSNEESDDNPIHDTPTEWAEPNTPYNALYPHNEVYEGRSGHIREIDNTPDNERLHEYHKSGTFTEIHPDGSKVQKIVGSDYEVIVNNRNVLVKGNMSITVEGDAQVYIQGNSTTLVDGNRQHETVGNSDYRVTENKTDQVYGNSSRRVDLDDVIHIIQNQSSIIDEELDERVNGNVNIHYDANELKQVQGTVTHNVEGEYLLDCNSHIEMRGPSINVGIDGKEPAVLGDKLDTQLKHLIEIFSSHTHIANLGNPTSTPTVLGHIQEYMDPKSSTVKIQA